jgi:hypothetical protein
MKRGYEKPTLDKSPITLQSGTAGTSKVTGPTRM